MGDERGFYLDERRPASPDEEARSRGAEPHRGLTLHVTLLLAFLRQHVPLYARL